MATRIYRTTFSGHLADGTLVDHTMRLKFDRATDTRVASDAVNDVDSWLTIKIRNMAFTNVTYDTVTVTEEVDWWNGTVPDQAIKSIGLAGTLGAADGKASRAQCAWMKFSTGVPVKGAHGGMHSPPWNNSTSVGSDGLWLTSGGAWTAVQDLASTLLAGHDQGTGGIDGHISLVVYSTTRRRRGDANYYFDVKSIVVDRNVHFLRSRLTTP